ncbi:hypothetical protein [Archangium sp.]|uniref:hypothetical protein n=1 Tax=Archangium sp. TaxID=1872627 RepID=UPI002EDA054C
MTFNGRRPELARLIRTESSAGGSSFEVLFEKWLTEPRSLLQRELSAAVEDGTIRPIDWRFAYFALIGASTQAFAEPETARRAFGLEVRDEGTIAQYAEFVVGLVMQGLVAPPAPDERSAARKAPSRRQRD